MWDSEHFTRSEFECSCGCGFDTIDYELVRWLDRLRNHFDRKITINSGCRCDEYNAEVGGAENSQHPKARAADIEVEEVPPDVVYSVLDEWGVQGLGKYKKFTHLDTRSGPKARW